MEPEFNTPAFWGAVAAGRISWERAAELQARRDRARMAKGRPPRQRRLPPVESPAFARAMRTDGARDQNLGDLAWRLVAILVQFAGRRGWVTTTKARLAAELGRSERTIQRALRELETENYIERDLAATGTGKVLAQRIIITARLRPAWSPVPPPPPGGETWVSPTKKTLFIYYMPLRRTWSPAPPPPAALDPSQKFFDNPPSIR